MKVFKQYTYYMLIGLASFIALVFLPLLSSEIEAGFDLPQTSTAWIIWISSRVAASLLNMLIYHCFIRQGDLNTKNNEERRRAEAILNESRENKGEIPLSPKRFFIREYTRKLPSIFLMTALTLIAFGPAILRFDLVVFASYLGTTIMAIICGILEMKKVETYYTEELIKYAKYKKEHTPALRSSGRFEQACDEGS